MKLITLNCPSCGGELALPDNLTMAHCMYCGQKVTIEGSDALKERQQIARYEELCSVAFDAENTTDLVRYADQILELDPGHVGAWIYKAHAALAQTTINDDRVSEAQQYLTRAEQLDPDDQRIGEAREKWSPVIFSFYMKAGANILNEGVSYIFSGNWGMARQSRIQAMECNLKGIEYAPDAEKLILCLESMSILVSDPTKQLRVQWGPEVHAKLRMLDPLKRRVEAKKVVQQKQAERGRVQAEINALRPKSGFFAARKLESAEKKLAVLDLELEQARKQIADGDRILAERGLLSHRP